MKLKYLNLILAFFIINLCLAQEVPNVEKLQTTAKIWGFLKYYHPEVAAGNRDWDSELINILLLIKKAKDTDALSKVYIDWIVSLGAVKDCKKCTYDTKGIFDKNFDLSWISNQKTISTPLALLLKNIEKNRFQGKAFYVAAAEAGNFVSINEKNYEEIKFPDESYRLLGLFRYWNTIEYFYPYKYLLDKNWNEILEEMIPKYIIAKNKEEYHLAIQELIGSVDDSHTWIALEEKGDLKFFPGLIKNIDSKCVVSSFYNDELAKKEGLQMGDVILKINGKDVQEEVQKRIKYTPASNLNRKIGFIYLNLLNSRKKDSIYISVKRGEQIIEKRVKLYKFYDELKYYDNTKNKTWQLLQDGKIGYVKMRLLDKDHKTITTMMNVMMNTKGIIFDLRGYPKTSFYFLSNYLNSERKPFVKIVNPDLSYPGKFKYSNTITTGRTNKNYFKGKVLILVDEQSFSLSEFAAMCLQTADKAITIGTQTAAADGNVSTFQYMGGFDTTISGKGVYYPDGSETQRVGIKINYIVNPTITGLMESRDEILEKAIEIIIEE